MRDLIIFKSEGSNSGAQIASKMRKDLKNNEIYEIQMCHKDIFRFDTGKLHQNMGHMSARCHKQFSGEFFDLWAYEHNLSHCCRKS